MKAVKYHEGGVKSACWGSIPTILFSTLQLFLTVDDLAQCMRVASSWKHTTRQTCQTLVRTLRLDTSMLRAGKTMKYRAAAIAFIARHYRQLRHLSIVWPDVQVDLEDSRDCFHGLEDIVEANVHLDSLHLDPLCRSTKYSWLCTMEQFSGIPKHAKLRAISVMLGDNIFGIVQGVASASDGALESLVMEQSERSVASFLDVAACARLVQTSPKLHTLRFSAKMAYFTEHQDSRLPRQELLATVLGTAPNRFREITLCGSTLYGVMDIFKKVHPDLKILRMTRNRGSRMDEWKMVTIVTACPALETLVWDFEIDFSNDGFRDFLTFCPPSLVAMEVALSYKSTLTTPLQILTAHPIVGRLTRLSLGSHFDRRPSETPATVLAFFQKASSLGFCDMVIQMGVFQLILANDSAAPTCTIAGRQTNWDASDPFPSQLEQTPFFQATSLRVACQSDM